MIVMKFGGSSVADASRVRHVEGIVRQHLEQKPVVVLSATGDTTDHLLECGSLALKGKVDCDRVISNHQKIAQDLGIVIPDFDTLATELRDLLRGISLLKELSPRTKDYLVSFGERISVRLFAAYLKKQDLAAQAFDAWDVGFLSDSRFGNGEILPEAFAAIEGRLGTLRNNYSFTPVVTGFIAKDRSGNITTLGRGGSDLTACALGAALQAKEVQVWKDVDGILTTNPNYVPAARPVPVLSFEEASELAYFGANVLHPRALIPAMQRGVPVRVKNSYNVPHPGTVISNQGAEGLAKAITCKRNLTLVDVVSLRMLGQPGFLSKLFAVFEKHELSVDMVATSEVSVSLTLDEGGALDGLRESLEEFSRVSISSGKASVNIIADVRQATEVLESALDVFRAEKVNVQMLSHGASKVQFGFIVNDSEAQKCVAALHARFFES
ncbi:MAG: aspartate kinase [Deltaproteobacteria bacterium]|nr:aspartate kinase [Deltaproteobacteria bacterium]